MPLVKKLLRRTSTSLRFRLGLRVAAPELESGNDEEVAKFYSARVTDCDFLRDPDHYEHPRAEWIVDQVEGGNLLEIGCGNGLHLLALAAEYGRGVGIDLSPDMIVAARGLREASPWADKIRFRVDSAEQLETVADGSVDVALCVGALFCGFFWELWNFYSYPKWTYHTPGVGFWYIFEMPLIGDIGYLPFALELYALLHLATGRRRIVAL